MARTRTGELSVGSLSRENRHSCPVPGCGSSEKHGHLLRYAFRLPEPIGVDDGYTSLQVYQRHDSEQELAFAHVTIRQVEMESADPTTLSLRSLARLGFATGDGDGVPEMPGGDPPSNGYLHSVAQVVTLASSPDEPPPHWDHQPQSLGPREDSFMRALHAVQTVVRGVKLADMGKPPLLPTYERAPSIVLVNEMVMAHGLRLEELGKLEWDSESAVFLEHSNAPGELPHVVPSEQIDFWGDEIGKGNPAVFAKERFIDAKRLIHTEGDYGAAVVAAATGIEILCDAVLSALLWEEYVVSGRQDAESALTSAADLFSGDVTPLRRAGEYLVSRLGGDWTSPSSPWQAYRDGAAGQRNRIVHAGYQPKRQEAEQGRQQALDVQTFLFDRLAAQRNKYPRACYVFLGRPGLESRNLYRGKIKKFFEEAIPIERSCSELFSAWHRHLVAKARA